MEEMAGLRHGALAEVPPLELSSPSARGERECRSPCRRSLAERVRQS